MKIKALFTLLLVLFLVDQVFIAQEALSAYRIVTKPLLLPLITCIYYVKCAANGVHLNKLFLLGLFFSFGGDLLLLFEWALLPGLASFLVAHVCYIISFRKKLQGPKWGVLPFIGIYLILLLIYLFPHLNEMKIPVVLYGITIATMLWFSTRTSLKWLIAGAVLFVISDSILAVNLFVHQTTTLSLLVMITYFLAQLALVEGMTRNTKKH